MHKFKIQSHFITTILELVAIATSKANHQQSSYALYMDGQKSSQSCKAMHVAIHFFSLKVYMQASQLAGLRVAYIAMRPCTSLFSFRVWSWVALFFHPTCKK